MSGSDSASEGSSAVGGSQSKPNAIKKRAASPTKSEVAPKKHRIEGPEQSALPQASRFLSLTRESVGPHWRGRESLRDIVVFGDSYSRSHTGKTWVDHLKDSLSQKESATKVHNFAARGATAEDDLSAQLASYFEAFPAGSSKLDANQSCYMLFIGINDCGTNEADDLESIVETVFETVHDLYVKAGARNFVLFDVPPIHRSPQALDSGISDEIEERVKTWNESLREHAEEFAGDTESATVFIFSSHEALTEVLDDPEQFDFGADDPTTEEGDLWLDELHLTPAVHAVFAKRLLASLVPE